MSNGRVFLDTLYKSNNGVLWRLIGGDWPVWGTYDRVIWNLLFKTHNLIYIWPTYSRCAINPIFGVLWRLIGGGFCQSEKLMTELFGIYYSRRVIWCTYDRHTRRCMINLKMGGLRGGPTKNWPIFETYDRPILTWDQMFYKFQWSNLPYARCMINLHWRSDY